MQKSTISVDFLCLDHCGLLGHFCTQARVKPKITQLCVYVLAHVFPLILRCSVLGWTLEGLLFDSVGLWGYYPGPEGGLSTQDCRFFLHS